MTNTERLEHIAAWRSSGLSRPEYCKQNGLKYPTFMRWFQLESEEKQDGKFIALSQLAPREQIVIQFPNGIRVEYQGQLSRSLLDLLQNA